MKDKGMQSLYAQTLTHNTPDTNYCSKPCRNVILSCICSEQLSNEMLALTKEIGKLKTYDSSGSDNFKLVPKNPGFRSLDTVMITHVFSVNMRNTF